MTSLRSKLRRFTAGGILLREVRAMRQELQGLREVGTRIALALEAYNAHTWPQQVQPNPDLPAVEVTYVDTEYQIELMDIEARLTSARGAPPSDEEVLAEYVRRHPDSDVALELGGLH
jgi:hypothetical protein